MSESRVILCTANTVLARAVGWQDGGFAHAAIISQRYPGMWLDARGGGVAYRKPETNLHRQKEHRLPFDLEEAADAVLGMRYNFKGVIAKALHFHWGSHYLFCSGLILNMAYIVGKQMADREREQDVDPWELDLILTAYTRGLETWMLQPR